MIILKSKGEIQKMRQSGDVAAAAMEAVLQAVRPGISTKALDRIAADVFAQHGAKSAFLNYNGFPGNICISINEQVVHGIPGNRRLKEGDIVSIDLGAKLHGYCSDMARTIGVGQIAADAQQLIDVTKECFYRGMAQALPGNHIVQIGDAVQAYAQSFGFGIVTQLIGHGVGQDLHEGPDIPNFHTPSKGPRIKEGMTLAIEPMINLGTGKVSWKDDGWTVVTADGKYAAHYENTVAVSENGPEILTRLEAY